jgi:hypothetical protein
MHMPITPTRAYSQLGAEPPLGVWLALATPLGAVYFYASLCPGPIWNVLVPFGYCRYS